MKGKLEDQKIIDIGDQTGSPEMYCDNDDKGRGKAVETIKNKH